MPRPLVAISMLSLVVCTAATAQRTWKELDAGRSIGLDVIKGFFKAPTPDFPSFAATLVGRIPASPKLTVTGAIPFARLGQSDTFSGASSTSTGFGNPAIGLEYASARDLTLEVQFRPGFASYSDEGALSLGFVSDFDHFEAWLPKTTTFQVTAHSGEIPAHGEFASGIFGGTVTVPGAESGENPRVFGNYGVRVGYRAKRLMGYLGVTGRIAISGGGTLAQRTIHQLALTVEGVGGRLLPYASVRNYLDPSIRKSVDVIVAVGGRVVF